MKKYIKELIVIFLQACVFYIGPLADYTYAPIGFMFMLLIWTFALSVIFGAISDNNFKYFYPFIAAALFVPSVFIIYNSSALIYVIFHFLSAYLGIFIGRKFNMDKMIFAIVVILLLCIGGGTLFSGINAHFEKQKLEIENK